MGASQCCFIGRAAQGSSVIERASRCKQVISRKQLADNVVVPSPSCEYYRFGAGFDGEADRLFDLIQQGAGFEGEAGRLFDLIQDGLLTRQNFKRCLEAQRGTHGLTDLVTKDAAPKISIDGDELRSDCPSMDSMSTAADTPPTDGLDSSSEASSIASVDTPPVTPRLEQFAGKQPSEDGIDKEDQVQRVIKMAAAAATVDVSGNISRIL